VLLPIFRSLSERGAFIIPIFYLFGKGNIVL
jgi:hypothetical protein